MIPTPSYHLNKYEACLREAEILNNEATNRSTAAMRVFVDEAGSIRQAATQLGITFSMVSHVLAGRRRISPKIANRMRFFDENKPTNPDHKP